MDNGMTLSDYMTLEKVGNRNRGVANTALGLGIGLGSAALIGVILTAWGVNSVSKARSRSAEKMAEAATVRTNDIVSLLATERSSRENWERLNQPTLSQVIELQNNPSLQSTVQDIVSAMASAQAQATAIANNGINSAIGGEHFVRVQQFSAPQPCGCPGCGA